MRALTAEHVCAGSNATPSLLPRALCTSATGTRPICTTPISSGASGTHRPHITLLKHPLLIHLSTTRFKRGCAPCRNHRPHASLRAPLFSSALSPLLLSSPLRLFSSPSGTTHQHTSQVSCVSRHANFAFRGGTSSDGRTRTRTSFGGWSACATSGSRRSWSTSSRRAWRRRPHARDRHPRWPRPTRCECNQRLRSLPLAAFPQFPRDSPW